MPRELLEQLTETVIRLKRQATELSLLTTEARRVANGIDATFASLYASIAETANSKELSELLTKLTESIASGPALTLPDAAIFDLDIDEESPSRDHYADAAKQGEELLAEWTRDGTLVKSTELAKRWGRTRQALDQACDRQELFRVKVGNRQWYPVVFLRLTADQVKKVSLALGAGDPSSMLMFCLRKHGGLGGRTIADAITAGELKRVVELAREWSRERGWVHAEAA